MCVCVDKREQVDKSCLLEKACVLVQTQARSIVRFVRVDGVEQCPLLVLVVVAAVLGLIIVIVISYY